MAEEFLEPIYQEAKVLYKLRQIVEWTKVNDSHHVVITCNEIIQDICDICKRYTAQEQIKGMKLWNVIQTFTKTEGDLILLGDIVEQQVLPLLQESMKQWGEIITENEEGDYRFETTASGFLTIKSLERNHYYHSTVDPMWEARKMAEYIFDPEHESYSLLGCGLGYLAYQLYLLTGGSVKINIYERDPRMIEYARSYGVLDWIPQECVNVVVMSDILVFLESAQEENVGFYLFPPALRNESEEERIVLEELCAHYNTVMRFERERTINFWRNAQGGHKQIEEFDRKNLKKDFIVAAAGPSLDENIEFLRENKGKKTIIAVGTVFKKLITNDIIPDMVAVLDPQARTYKQVEGMEEQEVPMLIAMSAYWKFAAAYQGEKYLIPTADMEEIVQFAKEKELKVWNCGGTVTALAIEIAIEFGAENIYLVGVDLAYPNGVSHATGTMDRSNKNLSNLIQVEGVNGQMVYSERVFEIYRKWMEDRIEGTPHITYYNMSRIGAKIAGAKDGTVIDT